MLDPSNNQKASESGKARDYLEECHILGSGDPLVCFLQKILRGAVRVLAVIMTLVIVWGLLDVGWVIYQRLRVPPYFLLNISDILATFGAFMAVLIAIEIFANIVVYLQSHVIHLRLVLATALMAAARKVIVLDFKTVEPPFVYALGVVILALALAFWLVSRVNTSGTSSQLELDGSEYVDGNRGGAIK
ncbi:phosphate-starvation-inducible PsiE family protein [Desulfohalovibrio reitneri]|uniref:phosphate-starvation-inducible PsiE family protein n=1 Tax=Desulfohalovibrio reitneri TaxID=1307759 RepID=UPI0009DE2A23|nr:phosphate-starvation-inducible PsiE family protein [Desulfohalovibrio reitneri]